MAPMLSPTMDLEGSEHPPIDPLAIKRRLREAREQAGYETASDLAAKISQKTGVNVSNLERNIQRWESPGGSMPKISDVAELRPYLNVTLDWIAGRELDAEAVLATVTVRVDAEVGDIADRLRGLIDELAAARRDAVAFRKTESGRAKDADRRRQAAALQEASDVASQHG